MPCRFAWITLALVALAVRAGAQGGYRPPAPPDVAWRAGEIRVVEIDPKDPFAKSLPTIPVPFTEDDRFLFGVTPGYHVGLGSGLWLREHRDDGTTAETMRIHEGERRKFPCRYGDGEPIEVPIEFLRDGNTWVYRIPAILEVVAGAVAVCFLDADGDGWFDDLDDDRVAIGTAANPGRLRFAPFPGEVPVAGQRYLVSANPRAAAFWPVSRGIRRDYVRHIAEINAVRRFGGLAPVGLAEELIPLCEAHSAYCGNWEVTHHENPGLRGYTRAGAWAGLHANVGHADNAISSIRILLATLWHRNHYYFPELERVGVGAAAGVVTSDVLTHRPYGSRRLIFAPIDRARDVPLRGENETPSPYVRDEVPGPFITVLLPDSLRARFVAGEVRPRNGKPLTFDVSDPERVAPASRGRIPDNDGCIVLVLHRALERDTLYDVKITATVNDEDRVFAWSFLTQAER